MVRIIVILVLACVAALYGPRLLQDFADNPESFAVSVPGDEPAREPARASGGTMVLKADRSGHFFAEPRINGRQIDAVIDTGATAVVLTYEDARSIGVLPPESKFTVPVSTANGRTTTAATDLREIRLGSIRVGNVRALVARRGELSVTLLGMSFLSRLSRADMRGGELVLRP
ncbi:retropepsin-like aspartic protease family protein [Rhodobium gokarnense]|uniref:Aspartyl protease family protein n=1 Tax=Rhodobium gokarnense TaxID=364296 RepID=A0ABT3H7Y7_9HYPH|nr:TIGR02281 family clan AA aspartic protease [Rhodobium gokarnense]MCW2306505.1 aspartyl protease family protein [Rhodobium gokarnense]